MRTGLSNRKKGRQSFLPLRSPAPVQKQSLASVTKEHQLRPQAHAQVSPAAMVKVIPRANEIKTAKILGKLNFCLALFVIGLFILAFIQGPTAAIMMISGFFTVLIAVQAGLRGLAIFHSAFSPQYFSHMGLERDPNKLLLPFASSNSSLSLTRQASPHWPLYTVLVPLKNEAHMVPSIIGQLSQLDYPHSRLQILLITESDDAKTCAAVANHLAPPFEAVIVPRSPAAGPAPDAGGPRTKPNALNVAMQNARGDIITIFDAEDAPDPAQLKTAVRAFRAHPHWAALQAPLDYYNAGETWLTTQFALEYAAQFHIWIPLMARLGMPFPLGGTSNHILRAPLEAIGGWDAYNVTEDADLSFRLAASGYTLGYITPPTAEEAVARLRPWTAQRTRWMKGFFQSWLVHMDQPFAPGGIQGLKRQITLQLTLGTVLLAGLLHTPICAGLMLWAVYHLMTQGYVALPDIVYISMALGYGSGICMGIAGALRANKPRLIVSIWLMPFYWLLLVVPAWLAIVDLIRRPYYWSKTEHGLSRMTPQTNEPQARSERRRPAR